MGSTPLRGRRRLVAGTIWRYRYDQFGWTTRSSQLYESKLLRIASPLFHYGLFVVLAGHLMGLLIPKAWTDLVVSQETYHLVALVAGTLAGVATLVGIALLIYRRRTTGPVFLATTRNDKLMYVVLVAAIVFGMIATLTGDHTPTGTEHNYRETVSIWFRSLLVFQPDVEAMAASTWQFKVHILVGLGLFALCRSAGWCTRSPSPCTTSSGRTSCTAAGTSLTPPPLMVASAAGIRSAPRIETGRHDDAATAHLAPTITATKSSRRSTTPDPARTASWPCRPSTSP